MNKYLLLVIIILLSCKNEGQVVDLSKTNISYQEQDPETGWKRVLLLNPNKWGFINDKKEIVIPFEYDFLNPFENGLAYAKNNGKEFFITKKNLKLEGQFEAVNIFSEGLASAKRNGKWGFINNEGLFIISPQYDEVDYFRPSGLCAVTKNGRSGFIDNTGKEIIPIIYTEVYQEMKDKNVIVKKNGKWAVFNNEGKQLSEFIYDSFKRAHITDFSKDVFQRDESTFFENGAALVEIDGKYEFINAKAQAAFPKNKFDSASVFDTFKNAIVKRNGRYGIIKIDGTFKVPLEYDFINYFDDNHAFSKYYNARKGKIYHLYNRNLKEIGQSYEPVFNDFSNNTPTLIYKNLKSKYGIIDWQGNILVPFEFDELTKTESKDFFIVKKNGKKGLIGQNGNVKIPIIYKYLYELDEEKISMFVADEKIITTNNKIILSGFESIQPIFYNRKKLIVSKNKKFGIVDINKKVLLPLEFDEISNWVEYGPEKRHIVKKNGKYGMIEYETFKFVISPIYDKLDYIGRLIFANKNNKAGIIDENGRVICNFNYDQIYPSLNDLPHHNETKRAIFARKGPKYFQIDHTGKILKSGLTKPFVLSTTQIPEPTPPPRLQNK